MLPGQGKFGVVISKIPVMQSGLKVIFNENLPDYELSFCRSHDELTLLQLRPVAGWFLWSATASIRWPLSY